MKNGAQRQKPGCDNINEPVEWGGHLLYPYSVHRYHSNISAKYKYQRTCPQEGASPVLLPSPGSPAWAGAASRISPSSPPLTSPKTPQTILPLVRIRIESKAVRDFFSTGLPSMACPCRWINLCLLQMSFADHLPPQHVWKKLGLN